MLDCLFQEDKSSPLPHLICLTYESHFTERYLLYGCIGRFYLCPCQYLQSDALLPSPTRLEISCAAGLISAP